MNATVVLACRSLDKAEQAKLTIVNTTKCNPNKVYLYVSYVYVYICQLKL